MADRDDYSGYGDPSGRYAERGHFDRDHRDRDYRERDRTRGRRDTGIFSDSDRDRDYRDRDRDYRDRDRYGRDHDRGFFDRAGDEVRSWFSDDDDRDRSRRHERGAFRGDPVHYRGGADRYEGDERMRGRGDRDRDYGSGGYDRGGARWSRDGDRDRGDFGREYSTGRYGSGGDAMGGSRGYGGDRDRADLYRGGDRDRDRDDRSGRMGVGYGGGAGMGFAAGYGGTRSFGGDHPHDRHYDEWRRQQVASLDRDYEEYRNESRQQFHDDFSKWRGKRTQQRQHLGKVTEHMEVVGSDNSHIGTVDKVRGDRIILTKSDPDAGGHHHSIPCSWIETVADKVKVNKTAEQAKQQWRDEENRRALFEPEENRRDDGPHMLDRSFSGTYDRG